MSLFPAYGSSTSTKEPESGDKAVHSSTTQSNQTALDWLRNDSFSAEVLQRLQKPQNLVTISSGSESDSSTGVEEVIDLDSENEFELPRKMLRQDEDNVQAKSKALSDQKAPLGAIFLDDLNLAAFTNRNDKPLPYRIDRSSNSSLVKYGSIYEGHLSNYWSISRQFALATSKHGSSLMYRKKEEIMPASAKEKKEKKKAKEKRYFDRYLLKNLEKQQDIWSGRGHKSPLSVSNLPEVIKLTPISELKDEFPSSSVNSEMLPYDELKKASIRSKIEEFNRRLTEESSNVQLWLDFVEFQNDVARHVESQMTESALIEKKLAILDRALSCNSGNVQLLVEKIKLKSSTSANQDVVAEEWRNIAFVHPNNADVWWECLMAQCRRFAAFSIDKLLTQFSKCLNTLADICEGVIRSHKPGPRLEERMTYIFIALVNILREAGFTERALVLLQCQIEFVLFAPQHVLSLPRQKAIDELELYFSTGLPLYGLKDSVGWNKWDPKSQTKHSHSLVNLEFEDEIDRLVIERAPTDSSRSQLWAFLEEARTARRLLPLPDDFASQTDDPERQVLFDDVSRFLVKIQAPENRYRLLLAYFEFLGVDISAACDTLESFMKTDAPSGSFTCRSAVVRSLIDGTKPKLVPYDVNLLQDMINHGFNQVVGNLSEPFRTHLITVYVKQEILACLALEVTSPQTFAARAKQIKTLVREILREPANRNNLAIWAICAEVELRFGKSAKDAIRMAETAITMSHQLKLYSSWGALCHLACLAVFFNFKFYDVDLLPSGFEIGRIVDANVDDPDLTLQSLKLLASCLLRKSITGNITLENIDQFKLEVDSNVLPFIKFSDLPEPDGQEAEPQLMPVQPLICQLAECFALFTYLSARFFANSGKSDTLALTSADAVFTSLLNQVEEVAKTKTALSPFSTVRRFTEQVLIRLHASRITLASFDYRTNIKSVTHLKEIIFVALHDFSSNATFLRCLIALREPAFLSSSFVKFTRSMSHRIRQPLAWMAILNGIISKVEKAELNGASNLIRQLFEKSVASSLTNRCSILWSFYIAYEAKMAVLEGSLKRLDSVLFRGLQACPWAKEVYLALARSQKDQAKLQDAVDMIIEKGLRLHTLVDELDTFPGIPLIKA